MIAGTTTISPNAACGPQATECNCGFGFSATAHYAENRGQLTSAILHGKVRIAERVNVEGAYR